MKVNKNRAVKALVVIIIVGFGMVQNISKKMGFGNVFNPYNLSWSAESVKADTTQSANSSLFIYTKKIISTGISRLISNL